VSWNSALGAETHLDFDAVFAFDGFEVEDLARTADDALA
jgi:hypothetical protein